MAESGIEFVKVCTGKDCHCVAVLAKEIWFEHYIPIIGRSQVEYMVSKFQSAEAVDRQIKEEGFQYFLMKDAAGGLVGYFAIIPRSDRGELVLSKLYVKLHERNKGWGRAALEFIERTAEELGLGTITLTVNKNNTGSIKAYLNMGFVQSDSVVADIGNGFVMDDYLMSKRVQVHRN